MNSIEGSPLPPLQLGDTPDALAVQLDRKNPHSVDQVANGFENLFVSLVLKEMRQSLGPGTLFGGDSSDVYGGIFDQYLGQALTQGGGFGLAQEIRRQLAGHATGNASNVAGSHP
jgi:Rod binding domain-containing protein